MRVLTAVAVFGPLSALITQQPVAAPSASKAPKPAIVLLLKRPITLDADAARSRWARIVDGKVEATPQTTNAWLQADGADLVGGRDGVRFVVRAGAARDLDDHALRHLDDDNKKQVRSHSATLEVACTNDLPADADRRTSYRVLGSVAAALSARGVVGLGAADHGTFDPAPPPGDLRDKLLGEDPLGWLAPILNSSLVVFTRKQFALDESDLEAKLAKEFGVVFGSEDAEHFVVVDDRMTMIKVGDALVILTQRPAIASMKQAAAKYEDLRLRKAIGEHESMLHLATHGAATEAAESQRRRVLARIAAALWHDDFLVFSWHCNRAMLPAGEDVPSQLRADDPVAAMLARPVQPVVEAPDPAAMEQAIAQARREWPTAVAHHRAGGQVSAKLPFATKSGGTEHIWIDVTRLEGDLVHGTLANEPADIEGKKLGDAVSGKVADLSDWLFVRDGTRFGGFTVKILEARSPKQPR